MDIKGFEDFYSKLFEDGKRVVFEMFVNGEKKEIDAQIFCGVTDNFAANLSKQIKKNDSKNYVGVRMANSPYMYAVVFALMKAGYCPLLVDARTPDPECGRLLADTAGVGIVCDRAFEGDKAISVVDPKSLFAEAEAWTKDCWSDEIAISTSGTTGRSKLIVYDSKLIGEQIDRTAMHLKKINDISSLPYADDAENNRFISILPMNHIFGFTAPLIISRYGFRIIFPPNAAITSVIKAISEEKIWGCIGVPMFWQTIYNILMSRYGEVTEESVRDMLGERFRFILIGGSKTDIMLREVFSKAGLFIALGYGMTEVGCVTILFSTQKESDSEGKLYPWYECAVRDEDGNISENGTGELLVKSDILFKGYRKDGVLEERERVGTDYFPTGDIFRKEDNFIWFVGRCKNVIVNSAGENIYIEELEEHFKSIAKYADMYGIIDLNDQPCLLVQVKDGYDHEDLVSEITASTAALPVYKRPVKAVITKQKLPLSAKAEIHRIRIGSELLDDPSNAVINLKKEN